MKHKKKHHSDPIVGGTSENESSRVGAGAFAGMPTDVKMKAYPKNRYHEDALDDTMGHIDDVIRRSESTSQRHLSNQH